MMLSLPREVGAHPEDGDMITAVVTFAQAEEMLGATYMRFEHRTGLALHRTLGPHGPNPARPGSPPKGRKLVQLDRSRA